MNPPPAETAQTEPQIQPKLVLRYLIALFVPPLALHVTPRSPARYNSVILSLLLFTWSLHASQVHAFVVLYLAVGNPFRPPPNDEPEIVPAPVDPMAKIEERRLRELALASLREETERAMAPPTWVQYERQGRWGPSRPRSRRPSVEEQPTEEQSIFTDENGMEPGVWQALVLVKRAIVASLLQADSSDDEGDRPSRPQPSTPSKSTTPSRFAAPWRAMASVKPAPTPTAKEEQTKPKKLGSYDAPIELDDD